MSSKYTCYSGLSNRAAARSRRRVKDWPPFCDIKDSWATAFQGKPRAAARFVCLFAPAQPTVIKLFLLEQRKYNNNKDDFTHERCLCVTGGLCNAKHPWLPLPDVPDLHSVPFGPPHPASSLTFRYRCARPGRKPSVGVKTRMRNRGEGWSSKPPLLQGYPHPVATTPRPHGPPPL